MVRGLRTDGIFALALASIPAFLTAIYQYVEFHTLPAAISLFFFILIGTMIIILVGWGIASFILAVSKHGIPKSLSGLLGFFLGIILSSSVYNKLWWDSVGSGYDDLHIPPQLLIKYLRVNSLQEFLSYFASIDPLLLPALIVIVVLGYIGWKTSDIRTLEVVLSKKE
jgi:hypothetical protein